MKKKYSFTIILVSLSIAVLLLTTSCRNPQLAKNAEESPAEEVEEVVAAESPEASEPSQPRFPLETTIRSQSGKVLVGRILAKSGDDIAFQRHW